MSKTGLGRVTTITLVIVPLGGSLLTVMGVSSSLLGGYSLVTRGIVALITLTLLGRAYRWIGRKWPTFFGDAIMERGPTLTLTRGSILVAILILWEGLLIWAVDSKPVEIFRLPAWQALFLCVAWYIFLVAMFHLAETTWLRHDSAHNQG